MCGDTAGKVLVREIRSLEILSVRKEAKLSVSEVTEVEEGKGDEDMRCRPSRLIYLAYSLRETPRIFR